MKVLIGAYACEPGQGSEPAVGWHWAREAVQAGHDVWVITRSNNRAAIEAGVATSGRPAPTFEYVDLPRPFLWAKRRFGHLGLLGYAYLWQGALALRARALHRRVGFDVVHHVTFVNDTLPAGLAFVRAPFVWGPVGGSTHRLPKQIDLDLPRYARRHERLRATLQFLLRHVDPFVAITRRRAGMILVYTQEALAGLPRGARRKARAVVHVGVSETEPPHRTDPPVRDGRRLRVLTGGRLVHWKGYDLLIEGFARHAERHPGVDARLIITGSGPYKPWLEKLADDRGVGDLVDFPGFLPRRDDVFSLMGDCDLVALPTLRDGPPVALLEAMAYGLPVLCLDLGATAELVPREAGFRIPPESRETIVAEIAERLAWLRGHPDEAVEMGRRARAYCLDRHHWSEIRRTIDRAYSDVPGTRS